MHADYLYIKFNCTPLQHRLEVGIDGWVGGWGGFCHYNKQVQEISPAERLDMWRRNVRGGKE